MSFVVCTGARADERPGLKKASSDELVATLETALKDQEAQTAKANSERAQAEASKKERRAQIDALFKKGRQFYAEGNFEEAIAEWEKLVGLVDEEVTVRGLLKALRAARAEARAAAESARQAQATAPQTVSAPAEVLQYLQLAEQKLREASRELGRNAAVSSGRSADRQKEVDQDLARAAELYDQGRTEEAFALWEKTAGQTENADALLSAVTKLKAARAELVKDQRMYEDISLKAEAFKARVPGEVLQTLETAQTDLVRAVAEAKSDAAEAEKQMAVRRAWVDAKFREGKFLYDRGRYSEAIQLWEVLIPFLEDSSRFKKLIEEFKRKSGELASEGRAAAQAQASVDEIDRMMLEYNVMTPEEVEKRGQRTETGK